VEDKQEKRLREREKFFSVTEARSPSFAPVQNIIE